MDLNLAYFLLSLALCAGAIQITAAYSRMRGLLIIPHTPVAYAVGIALPVLALTWFSLSGYAGIPGDIGGVEGAEQFILFLLGAGAATLASGIAASLTQRGGPVGASVPPGMEGLRNHTLLALLRVRLAKRSSIDRNSKP